MKFEVKMNGHLLSVKCPYKKENSAFFKSLHGKWDVTAGIWNIPYESRKEVFRYLKIKTPKELPNLSQNELDILKATTTKIQGELNKGSKNAPISPEMMNTLVEINKEETVKENKRIANREAFGTSSAEWRTDNINSPYHNRNRKKLKNGTKIITR